MNTILIIAFVLGYILITLEHKININKAAIALLTGVMCWTVYIISNSNPEGVVHELIEHLGDISQILFFLLGAMTIVELIDSYNGFDVISKQIKTTNKRTLLITVSFITFFLSAILDNLTTTIVMVTLVKKLLQDKEDRWLFAGMIIIAANAGGAWTPIGDVTTTMLWIGGQISAGNIMKKLFIPSLISMIVPLLLISRIVKGKIERTTIIVESKIPNYQKYSFYLGISALVFVPIFKSITHLPPFMGILIGLAILWIVTEYLHRKKK
ncbi:MAG: hypothetical protein HC854_16825 [Flavobacterium sp.]|nr:hypothetical protein [Flavobacterium sp.]